MLVCRRINEPLLVIRISDSASVDRLGIPLSNILLIRSLLLAASSLEVPKVVSCPCKLFESDFPDARLVWKSSKLTAGRNEYGSVVVSTSLFCSRDLVPKLKEEILVLDACRE
jgi:hypothetical protein